MDNGVPPHTHNPHYSIPTELLRRVAFISISTNRIMRCASASATHYLSGLKTEKYRRTFTQTEAGISSVLEQLNRNKYVHYHISCPFQGILENEHQLLYQVLHKVIYFALELDLFLSIASQHQQLAGSMIGLNRVRKELCRSNNSLSAIQLASWLQ